MKHLFAVIAATLIAAPAAAATVDISASERGGNVILTGSGSIDLSGSLYFGANDITNLNGNTSVYFVGSEGASDIHYWFGPTGLSMSSNSFDFDTSGNNFGYDTFGGLALDAGYVSGSAIDFVWTVAGSTIDQLGLNFGLLGTLGNNEINLIDGRSLSEVPLPASAFLLLAGLGGLTVVSRRKEKLA